VPDKEPAIYKAMGKVMSGLKVLEKKQRNDFSRYDYRGIDDLLNSVHGLLDSAGIVVLPRCLTENPKLELGPTTRDGKQQYTILLKMSYLFMSTQDGSTVESGPFVGEGIDTSDKCSNKAQTAAFKWCFFQTFCVPVSGGMTDSEDPNDIDKDNGPHTKPPAKPPAKPTAKPPAKPTAKDEKLEHSKDRIFVKAKNQLIEAGLDPDDKRVIERIKRAAVIAKVPCPFVKCEDVDKTAVCMDEMVITGKGKNEPE